MTKLIQFTLLFSVFLLLACKKIDVPSEDAKKIFGSWEYVSNTGGMSGSGGSYKYVKGQWVEFTDKGKFIVYEGNKKISKFRFKIEMRQSIYGGERPGLLYNIMEQEFYESYQVTGDKLIISDEFYDGYSYIFKRK